MTRRLVLRLSISQNNVFNLTTDIQEMLDPGFRCSTPSFRPSLGPLFAGNDTSRKVVLPRYSSDIRFQHFGSRWCFNLHTEASDEVGDMRGTFRHTLEIAQDTERA
ncbi:hypothetical protein TNIN_6641 [Trichonephila inaurata madagascariensis]|uniref:Uncharacterized protein n=1 Tax=Trichonephila inaurata madagascariensis TaxID=2747483 RepID=A0A8X6IB31_9ARAC|nr:hypothetical protein TNIN_6641 [Trichonephila inaurata madagascariensis]